MKELEFAKAKLAEYKDMREKQWDYLRELHGEEGFELDDDIWEIAEWFEKRDVEYPAKLAFLYGNLVSALEQLESGDKNAAHRAKKVLEETVRQARRIKADRTDDLRKAQEQIDALDSVIKMCDNARGNTKRKENKE